MLATDPGLAAKLERRRRLAARLRAANNPALEESAPERPARTVRGGGTVISLAEARATRAAKVDQRPDWRAGAVLAASLVAALAVGQTLLTTRRPPVAEEGGQLVGSGALGRALDTQLSGGGGTVRVRLTYRDRAGSICRSFTGALAAGVACRENGRWALQALFPGAGPAGQYGMAGDPRVMQIVDETISGKPFDSAQEHAAKARHWAPSPR
jgi:hypothetical protein